jgi:hypothetical protein
VINWLLGRIPCFASHLIGTPENPYLLRKYLTPRRYLGARWPGVFLHRFFRSDADRCPHNHPWRWSISLILTGGYIEERVDRDTGARTYRTRRPLSFNVIRENDFHKATLLDTEKGCWTLFVALGHRQTQPGHEWGFLDPDTLIFTCWKDYLPAGADGLEGD